MKALLRQRRKLPSLDPNDHGFRRLQYVRYADDFLLGFIGTRREAAEIKQEIKEWLQEHLALELSEKKTLITHATSQAARFLGYEIVNQQAASRKEINGCIGLRVPTDVREKKCARYTKKGKPTPRPILLAESDYAIVNTYQQEYRGIVQYYLRAYNVSSLNKLQWVMWQSLCKTLAAKHHTRSTAMNEKYRTTITTAEGKSLMCLEVRVERQGKDALVARFGGIPLKRNRQAVLIDSPIVSWNQRSELLTRLTRDTCELCGSNEDIAVHHIRALKDLRQMGRKEKPLWVRKMAAMRRKTLVVCHDCHVNITYGRPTRVEGDFSK